MTTNRRTPSQNSRRAPVTESTAPVTVSLNPPPEEPKLPLERVGDLLKRVRLERGDDLQQVADYLCIRKSFLVALENNRYEEFPADAYVIGFLRSYAEYLGVNGKDAIDRYRNEMAGRRRKPTLMIPTPITEGRTPSAVIMAACAVGALLLYAMWYAFSSSDRSSVSTPPALPTAVAPADATTPTTDITATASAPAASTTPSSFVPPTEQSPAIPAAPNSLAASPAGIQIAAPAPATTMTGPTTPSPAPAADTSTPPTQAAPPTPTPAPAATDAAKDAAKEAVKNPHLVIRAEQSTWVLITDSKGHPVYDHVMKPGETYYVPRTPNLNLTAGNGSGITLTLDGTELPKISTGSSHVVRNLPLDDQHLRNMPSNPDE